MRDYRCRAGAQPTQLRGAITVIVLVSVLAGCGGDATPKVTPSTPSR